MHPILDGFELLEASGEKGLILCIIPVSGDYSF
jgi:hypothetical protein